MSTNQVNYTEELTEQFFTNLRISVFRLANFNNGYFKSRKQCNYVKPQLDRVNGVVGYDDGTNSSVYYYVDYDDTGIKEIKYRSKNKKEYTVKFQRTDDESFSKRLEVINRERVESTTNKIEELKVKVFQNENQIGYLREIKKTHPHVKSSIDIAIKNLQESVNDSNKEIEELKEKINKDILVYTKG